MLGHIRTVIHQLRLRVDVILLQEEQSSEEARLVELLQDDYYYQKLLPLVICDATREICMCQQKKVMQNGVARDAADVVVR